MLMCLESLPDNHWSWLERHAPFLDHVVGDLGGESCWNARGQPRDLARRSLVPRWLRLFAWNLTIAPSNRGTIVFSLFFSLLPGVGGGGGGWHPESQGGGGSVVRVVWNSTAWGRHGGQTLAHAQRRQTDFGVGVPTLLHHSTHRWKILKIKID